MSDTSETPADTTEAPATEAQPTEAESFDALVAKISDAPGDETPDESPKPAPKPAEKAATEAGPEGEEETEEETEARKLPDPEPPKKFKPKTQYEHIQERKIAQLERQRQAQEQSSREAEQRLKDLENQTRQYQAREAQLQAAMRSGDPEEILKAAGLPVTLEQLNRKLLEKRGAIRPPDPEVLELRKKLEMFENNSKQRETQAQQAARERAQQEEYQAEISAISADLESHPDERAQWLSKIPGAVDTLYQVLNSGEEGLTFDQAAGRVFHTYRELRQRMLEVPGESSPDSANSERTTGTVPAKNEKKKPSSIPRGGGTPGATPPSKYADNRDGFDAFLRDQGAI